MLTNNRPNNGSLPDLLELPLFKCRPPKPGKLISILTVMPSNILAYVSINSIEIVYMFCRRMCRKENRAWRSTCFGCFLSLFSLLPYFHFLLMGWKLSQECCCFSKCILQRKCNSNKNNVMTQFNLINEISGTSPMQRRFKTDNVTYYLLYYM